MTCPTATTHNYYCYTFMQDFSATFTEAEFLDHGGFTYTANGGACDAGADSTYGDFYSGQDYTVTTDYTDTTTPCKYYVCFE